ncbi:hypothetical protein G4X40_16620 [Rhodococcus sp. D2-41]|uniref:YihY/virulence factor BrkB family protein n=1 Tax=Speluncibacter jeojiensis TaxID=2710754 RepID=A0A9X4M0R2_9ACTN|nr:YhjD/YihY/BrkB family envelope integrity protein [Rhodococcus sp. D2-41]MDG3011771.1 hypothetical protein [Rhodococcus sp. D2-41]MDG3014875.1 YihY/virulence factor BrkB family protein [Corynebacteriales bacterium D3-21]
MKSTKLAELVNQEKIAAHRQNAEGWLLNNPVGRTAQRILDGFLAIELTDRAMTLAAQSFSSVLPVVIAVASIRQATPIRDTLTQQFGVSPSVLKHFEGVDYTAPTYTTFGVIGILMLIISGTSFARALGRVYARIWDVEPAGIRGAWRWLVAVLAAASAVAGAGAATRLAAISVLGPPLEWLAEFLVWLALWTLLPYLLTEGRISGRPLWATGFLTAVAVAATRIGARPFLTHSAASAQDKFGALGLVFTLISWAFVMWIVVIGVGVITKALLLDEGWVGKALRVKA